MPNDDFAKKKVIFQFMADTFRVKLPGIEKTYTHYPMTYDFEDYLGENDLRKVFVTKLIKENTGQCHSLPLLYLILAEELGTKAYLSYSPKHTYVKAQDPSGKWFNIELTIGMTTTNAHVMASGFVKREAIESRLFMDTMGLKRTIVHCMADLAMDYSKKYGDDAFVLRCTDVALKHHPANVSAMMVKSNYTTALSQYVLAQLKSNRFSQQDSAQYMVLRDNTLRIYDDLDRLGHTTMPKDRYESWLRELEAEKQKRMLQRLQNPPIIEMTK